MASQKPASVEWTPVTDYSPEARRKAEGPHAKLIQETFPVETVADVGCGPGHLMTFLREVGVEVDGFDCDPATDYIWHDITKRSVWSRKGKRYELVICREVLEHLTVKDLRKAVTNLCESSLRYVYVTTRFHPNPETLFDVATSDDLDPTHITMLNKDLLRALFVLEGFQRRPEMEARLDWRQLGRVLVYERG